MRYKVQSMLPDLNSNNRILSANFPNTPNARAALANKLTPGQMKLKSKALTVQSSVQKLKVIDDQSLNDHIKRIASQRTAISDLALKYGLEDNYKVQKLSLLTLPNTIG